MLLWTLFFIVRIGVPYLSAASIGSSTNVIHAIPEIGKLLDLLLASGKW